MYRNILNSIVTLMALAVLALLVSPPVMGQSKVVLPPKGLSQNQQTLTPATSRDPARLRSLLLAIHGFSRQGLEAATTDVPVLLRQFISDGGESITVRRQAIKALRFYPTQDNLGFIQARVGLAPVGLKRLYASTLGRYSGALQAGASATLSTLVNDGDAGVRHAAIGAVRLLGVNSETRKALDGRLKVEADASVRRALSAALGD